MSEAEQANPASPQPQTRFNVPPPPPRTGKPPPADRGSPEEIRTRVLMIIEMLATGWRKCEIKQFFRKNWRTSARQTERYLAAARDLMRQELESLNTNPQQLVAESLACYQSIIKNPKSSQRDKILARRAIDELLGLQAPKKIAPTSPDGTGPAHIKVDMDVDQARLEQAMSGMTVDQLRAIEALNKIYAGQAQSQN